MQDPSIHPDPPSDLNERRPRVHETDRPWTRIHGLPNGPLYFGRERSSRFDDPERTFGVLYMAEDAHGAFIETFGRQLDVRSITASSLAARGLSGLHTSRALRLVDLASSGGLARLSADSRLTSGNIGPSQRWSRALWQHPIRADGIYYRLRHDNARCGCALFDRARDAMAATPQGSLSDPAHGRLLGDILDTYGFSLLAD